MQAQRAEPLVIKVSLLHITT